MEGNVDQVCKDPSVGFCGLAFPAGRPRMFVLAAAFKPAELVMQLYAIRGDSPVLLDRLTF